MAAAPQAFLSYTRFDDEASYGAITRLREELERQVRAVTGDRGFEIFQDIDGIKFGENWPEKLDEALASVRFLIPVMTPSFFKSAPCRDELTKFLAHEQAAGRAVVPLAAVGEAHLVHQRLVFADGAEAAAACAIAAGIGAQRDAVQRNRMAQRDQPWRLLGAQYSGQFGHRQRIAFRQRIRLQEPHGLGADHDPAARKREPMRDRLGRDVGHGPRMIRVLFLHGLPISVALAGEAACIPAYHRPSSPRSSGVMPVTLPSGMVSVCTVSW